MEKDEATAAVSEGVKAAVLGGELIQLKQRRALHASVLSEAR